MFACLFVCFSIIFSQMTEDLFIYFTFSQMADDIEASFYLFIYYFTFSHIADVKTYFQELYVFIYLFVCFILHLVK